MVRIFALALLTSSVHAEPSPHVGKTAVFLDGGSNVRSGPGTQFRAMFMPPNATRATILEVSGRWYNLRFDDGQVGWTNKQNIRIEGGGSAGALTIDCNGCKIKATADLDGDGEPEEIALKAYERAEGGAVRCALVVSKRGTVIWSDTAREFPCLIGDLGVQDLSIVGDIDQDGKVEVIIPAPMSDPSPNLFRVLQWDGGRFVLWRKGYLASADAEARVFSYVDEFSADSQRPYVAYFSQMEGPGVARAHLFGGSLSNGRGALVRFTANGVKVEKLLD